MNEFEVQKLARKVLKRVGFPEMLQTTVSACDRLHHCDLHWDNPRLQYLRESYQAYTCEARFHTLWTDAYIRKEISLLDFRQESGFLWQYRDANTPAAYLATYYCLRASNDADILAACVEDKAFNPFAIEVADEVITRDRLDSVSELSFIRRMLNLRAGSRVNVLDIGSGYGRFAWRLIQCFTEATVVCADAIPESTFLCEFYLNYRNAGMRAKVCALPELSATLRGANIDIAVAINSLTECSAVANMWWIDQIRTSNIRYILVVPHSSFDGGREIYSTGRDRSITTLLEERGYKLRVKEAKYNTEPLQRYGISPTYYHFFSL
jgi:SAM-dependent methyltransferase